jgi:radical SAM superfamily enzyme YgiQ (UPF0313 family)
MASAPRHRRDLIAAERCRLPSMLHGRLRIAVGYPGPYRLAMSSLAFQWVAELTSSLPEVGVERTCAGGPAIGRTLETGSPLAELDVLAWSCSFELDAVQLLRALDAAAIPRRRSQRDHRHPLIVVGGPLASLNPLPLEPAVDVFCLGAAERVWPQLVHAAATEPERRRLLRQLADQPGFFVPAHHTDDRGRPTARLRRLERNDIPDAGAEQVPASAWVTPWTEYSDRSLVEISRGCPERCRYCWISHAEGGLRSYPVASILDRVRQLSALTRRVGLVATAVGDHPGLQTILESCVADGVEIAVSSLRIPAVVPGVVRPLAASGARSLTIAPEAGSERLRRVLGKAITNDDILAAVDTAADAGIRRLKLYFLLGHPDETDDDLQAIARLTRDIRAHLGPARGAPPDLHLSVNPLVPKPYTPLFRAAMLDRPEWRRRRRLIDRGLRSTAVYRVDWGSHREAIWQGYLARGDASAFELLELAADGVPLGRLLTEHRSRIHTATLREWRGETPWHFIAPTR